MGEIILSQAGRVAGNALLPNGLSVLGAEISGAALGGLAGSIAGRSIDSAFAPALNGPRVSELRIMESREGAGIPNVYGRARVGGQLIWASSFKERRRQSSAGKGGPKINDYAYSVSFAVAVCEGPISRLGRVWANGEILPLDAFNCRLYTGSEDQLSDPLIEAVEGTGNAPAYRGTAYLVFEDMPLDEFGNRLPQLSFEVIRGSTGSGSLNNLARGINIIPASGEFVYGTTVVRERFFPGVETPLNMNNPTGASDFSASIAQLTAELPAVERASLTVAWFGNDLRAGHCRIRPGVETRERRTVPYAWAVAGESRETAKLISQAGGGANYGGTPSDRAVLEAIASLKAENIAVTLCPFLLMDIAPGNDLPDPYGGQEQAAFPWRGRIGSGMDRHETVRSELEAFLGGDGDSGYRHFILHHARLAAQAGGVEAFLIGSEMKELTRLRDETGAFPFVEGLVDLAGDVRAILGPDTLVSYAADWTEYGAYTPSDASGDVCFPLDPLWSSEDIDFVGVDWYPPITDWRDGEDHIDAANGHGAIDDEDYLLSGMQGGEGFDWYYATSADREQQVRTPIEDTAHGEHWVFRQKDIFSWWGAYHHQRPAGVRNVSPTAWSPGLKPVRFMEIGFPAVDKGPNAPNLFHDPKSAESALPPFSAGTRNDVLQRRALDVSLAYWQAQPMVDAVFAWAWDARPWPDFPVRDAVWSDGPNWALGHWLNGRTGLISLGEVIEDLADRAGVSLHAHDLNGLVEGFVLDGPLSLRNALEPLQAYYRFICLERPDRLVITPPRSDGALTIASEDVVEDSRSSTHHLLDKQPGRLSLSYIDGSESYRIGVVDARNENGEADYTIQSQLPLILSDAAAHEAAADILAAALNAETVEIAVGPQHGGIEPGDCLAVAGLPGYWVAADLVDEALARSLLLSRPEGQTIVPAGSVPDAGPPAPLAAAPELVLIDGPGLTRDQMPGPIAAIAGEPWPGYVSLRAGRDPASLTERGAANIPARIGRLAADLGPGAPGRWDRANTVYLEMRHGDLSSHTETAVLEGQNRLLVQGQDGWECLSFTTAALTGADQWTLTGLLRGLRGSPTAQAAEGAICILVDGALVSTAFDFDETGLELLWRAGESDIVRFTHSGEAMRPWPVAQLVKQVEPGQTMRISWVPTGPDIPDNWDLPDPLVVRQFEIEARMDGDIVFGTVTSNTSIQIETSFDTVRVAEISTEAVRGRWVSIDNGPP
jgi:hypothetical protein